MSFHPVAASNSSPSPWAPHWCWPFTPIAAQALGEGIRRQKSVLKGTLKAMAKVSGVHIYVTSKTGHAVQRRGRRHWRQLRRRDDSIGQELVKIVVHPDRRVPDGSPNRSSRRSWVSPRPSRRRSARVRVVMKSGTTPYTASTPISTTLGPQGGSMPTARQQVQGSSRRCQDYQLTWETAASSRLRRRKSVLDDSSGSRPFPARIITGLGWGDGRPFPSGGENVVEQATERRRHHRVATVMGCIQPTGNTSNEVKFC